MRKPKMRKYLSNEHKIGGAHIQFMNYHYASLNIKECKLLELKITDTL